MKNGGKFSILQRFKEWNVRASNAATPASLWKTRGFALYDLVSRAELGKSENAVVVDVGGGRTWPFAGTYHAKPGFHLIGVDLSAEELGLNPYLHEAIASDICVSLGLDGRQADLILSRATVEHLHDTSAFLRNAHAALRPGGRIVLLFAGKWATSTILNRLIPEAVAVRLLHSLVPNAKGYQGFKAYYDNCSYSQFRRQAKASGFSIVDYYPSYYNSSYFQFFFPLHCLSILHDLVRQFLSIRALSAMHLFVLEKTP